MSKKRRPKWATTKLPNAVLYSDDIKYPLSRCKHCPRRYHGIELDSNGTILREFACWDSCFYTNQRRDSNESVSKNVVQNF